MSLNKIGPCSLSDLGEYFVAAYKSEANILPEMNFVHSSKHFLDQMGATCDEIRSECRHM